ncbi:MAG: ATP-binding protein, partial [Alphaproteobacteria bacterium]
DTEAAAIPIRSCQASGGGLEPLDLTQSMVRANAPEHVTFLRNLGVRSSMSLAIDFDGHLWGLAVAHHYAPRHIPALRRVVCQMIVSSFSARLNAVEESLRQRDIVARRTRVYQAAGSAIERSGGELPAALGRIVGELRAMADAGGAFVRIGGVEARDGQLPDSETLERIVGEADARQGTLATDSLTTIDPSFAAAAPLASGAVARRLGMADDGVLVLVKGEVPEEIVWAGNPAGEAPAGDGWPDPARSLAPWSERTRGSARDWSGAIEPVLDVAERAILDVWRTLSERRAHSELRARVEELRTIYESVEEGIALVDATGTILSANARFGALVDRHALSVVGASIDALIEAIEPDPGQPVLEREVSRGRPRAATGRHRPIEIRVTRAGSAARPRHTVVLQDIAGREAFEHDLVRAREAAESASRAKDEFLANMSHELRTPLTALLGYIDLLDQQIIDPTQRRWIETMRRSGWSLLRILSDVVDFARIEAGELRLEETMFDPVAKAHSIVDLFRPTIDEKRLAAEIRVAPEVPRAVLGDAARIRQILSNLVGNAVKFTHAGGIAIDIAARPLAGHDRVELEFMVSDTGIGIPRDRLNNLFERFARVDRRQYGGVGLGLAISRRLAREMGGELTAESGGEGRGTRLRLRLPVPLAARSEPEPPASPTAPGRDRGRILVIEDDRVNQELLAEMARILGFEPEIAGDGESGIARAADGAPIAAMLVDVTLPGIDGLEATRRIRSSGTAAASVPIVCITALASDKDRDDALAAGADAYLTKPVRLADLRSALDRLTATA